MAPGTDLEPEAAKSGEQTTLETGGHNVDKPYVFKEIESLELGDSFLTSLRLVLEEAGPHVSWRTFGRLPGSRSQGGWPRLVIDTIRSQAGRQYCFLEASPAHDYLLRRFKASGSPRRWFWFDFLCRNVEVPLSELRTVLSDHILDTLLDRHFLMRRGDRVRMPVMIVPYANRYYIAEFRDLLEHPELYATRPTHISDQTHLQIQFVRRVLRHRRPEAFLDMGCGIGIACLELRPWCRRRTGADVYNRNVLFAQANARLWEDKDVEFVHSDLFANVPGRIDLINFNPWQPTEKHLPIVFKFLEEALHHLTDYGRIILCVSSTVVEEIAVSLRAYGYVADRWILQSWFDRDDGALRGVNSVSELVIRRADKREGRGPTIRLARDAQVAQNALRKALLRLKLMAKDRA